MGKDYFYDDLVPGGSGYGLMAVVHNACWIYSRHDPRYCEPGKWRVCLHGSEWGEWGDLLQETQAVVDDFGNLVRVH